MSQQSLAGMNRASLSNQYPSQQQLMNQQQFMSQQSLPGVNRVSSTGYQQQPMFMSQASMSGLQSSQTMLPGLHAQQNSNQYQQQQYMQMQQQRQMAMMQRQQYLQALYQIAVREFNKEDADLWYKYQQSQMQPSNFGNVAPAVDKFQQMYCIQIDKKIKAIYAEQNPQSAEQQEQMKSPSPQQQPPMLYQQLSWSQQSLHQQQQQQQWAQHQWARQQSMRASYLQQQQQEYMRQQSMSPPQGMPQFHSAPNPQSDAQSELAPPPPPPSSSQPMQADYGQSPELKVEIPEETASPMLNPAGSSNGKSSSVPPPGDMYTPSTGNRLRAVMEDEEKKKERERKRLERKKRRGLQKLKPSAQQKANEGVNEEEED